MFHLLNFKKLKDDPQLDIVGIVAVLGEGSIARNSQASALGWHHVLPRLLPAPQALLKHEHAKRLPTVPGTVVGAYSGRVKFELNFFCQLLHKDNLEKFQVELVEVTHRIEKKKTPYTNTKSWFRQKSKSSLPAPNNEENHDNKVDEEGEVFKPGEQAYDVKKVGPLVFLSLLGFAMAIAIAALSFHYNDGPAFLATFLLSLTSTVVGFASWWRLDFKEDTPKKNRFRQERVDAIPSSDVVIFYPRQGAFRIVRCSESIAKLHFETENCEHVCGDTTYRILALFASALLMMGLLTMGNSETRMQVAFAVAYITLNALYWLVSALNPLDERGHWKHNYHCEVKNVVMPSSTPDAGAPTRSDTTDSVISFVNEPHIDKSSFEVPVIDVNVTTSPTSVKSIEGELDKNKLAPALGNLRVPTIASREDVSSSSDSGYELKDMKNSRPPRQTEVAPPILHPLKTTTAATSTPTNPSKTTQRQSTMDIEGMRQRLVKPFGSVRDTCMDWLNKRKLISKRPLKKAEKKRRKEKEKENRGNVQDDTFLTALWKAIAITGTARWLRETHIAPDNDVWREWTEEAHKRAAQYISMPLIKEPGKKEAPDVNKPGPLVATSNKDEEGNIVLPSWSYQAALSELFRKEAPEIKLRPPEPKELHKVDKYKRKEQRVVINGVLRVWKLYGLSNKMEARVFEWLERARGRAAIKKSLRRGYTVPDFNARGDDGGLRPVGSIIQDFARQNSAP